MTHETISITLPTETAQAIHAAVAAGTHASTGDVVRDAVLLWRQRQIARERDLDGVRAKLDQASDDPRRLSDHEVGRHFDQRLAGSSR